METPEQAIRPDLEQDAVVATSPQDFALTAAPTISYRIWVAGSLEVIKQTCRAYCWARPFCVSVSPTTFIYKGGEEEGAVIGLINYPRFPAEAPVIAQHAYRLAQHLLITLHQWSCTIEGPQETVWLNRRRELSTNPTK